MQNAWFIFVLAIGLALLVGTYLAAQRIAKRAEERRLAYAAAAASAQRITPEGVAAAGTTPLGQAIDVNAGAPHEHEHA